MKLSTTSLVSLSALGVLAVFSGCSSSSCPADAGAGDSGSVLSPNNINLVFMVSEDLAYQGAGDVDPNTANLTPQGLQRALRLGSYVQSQVLGNGNVTAMYSLEPMTHLQTASKYPDMAALITLEQLAVLQSITLTQATDGGVTPYEGWGYPINVSYMAGAVPDGVAPMSTTPGYVCPACQGLDFTDQGGDNEALVAGIIKAKSPGFYVFAAPWETVSTLIANVSQSGGYGLGMPSAYQGPNYVYVVSISPSGSAALVSFNANITAPSTYPTLPPVIRAGCINQVPFTVTITVGADGAALPSESNTNEVVYFVRHAEAHPGLFESANYVAQGHWRALLLASLLDGQLSPDPLPTAVYSNDPALSIPGTVASSGQASWSYVRPSLTVQPYSISHGLPMNLAAAVAVFDQNPPVLATNASSYFFTGGKFSNQTVLVGWEHEHIPTLVNALITSYFPDGNVPSGKLINTSWGWPPLDYDSIWTVKLDGSGNLTVDNSKCEGILSFSLPAQAPVF